MAVATQLDQKQSFPLMLVAFLHDVSSRPVTCRDGLFFPDILNILKSKHTIFKTTLPGLDEICLKSGIFAMVIHCSNTDQALITAVHELTFSLGQYLYKTLVHTAQ